MDRTKSATAIRAYFGYLFPFYASSSLSIESEKSNTMRPPMYRSILSKALAAMTVTTLLAPSLMAQSSIPTPTFLSNAISAKMDLAKIPGLAACIVRDGKVLWADGFGDANIGTSLMATADTPFFLASISKTVTGVCLMQLEEQGLLDLDEDINTHLSFLVENPNHPGVPITFRQLLTHTSGLKDNWNVMDPLYLLGDSPYALNTFLPDYFVPGGAFYNPNANFNAWAPGSKYQYCNQAVSLVGLLVEVISGQDFADYAMDNVLTPLGMSNSSFRLADFDPNAIAMPYVWAASQYAPTGHYGYPDYPAGTLRSSVLDMAIFMQMIMEDGTYNGTQILSAASVQEMKTVQYPTVDNTQGLIFYYDNIFGDWNIGHDGGDPGVSTDMYYRPSDGVGVILLANSDFSFPQYYDIYEWLFSFADSLATEVKRVGVPPNPLALKPGVTSGPILGSTWDPIIDHTSFVTDSVLDMVMVSTAASNQPLGTPGTLLCDVSSQLFPMLNTLPGTPFSLSIPDQLHNLLGLQLYTQGASLDSSGAFHLTNALDITLGLF